MPRIALLATTAALLASPSFAAAPSVSEAFGNTLVSTYPDGRMAKLWLQPDGSYKAQGRRADPSSGRWKLKHGKLCLSQSHPFPAPFSYCTTVPAHGLGEAWAAKAVTGEAISVRLVKGGD